MAITSALLGLLWWQRMIKIISTLIQFFGNCPNLNILNFENYHTTPALVHIIHIMQQQVRYYTAPSEM
jgi:hypothetical protein